MKKIINIIWSFLCTVSFPIFISDQTTFFSNSVFSILMFALLILLFQYFDTKENCKRKIFFSYMLGMIFSFMTACGYSLDIYEYIDFKRIIWSIVLFSRVYGQIIAILWDMIDSYGMRDEVIPKQIMKVVEWVLRHPICICVILCLCWMPCYIAEFPGGFRADATREFEQITNGFNGNFPLLHSVIITRLLPIMYELTGTYNSGIIVYVIVQMILIAIMYSHIINSFYRQGVKIEMLVVILIYCACFPVMHILVTQTVRDVLFSALLTYVVFLFYLLSINPKQFMQSKLKPLVLGLVFILTLLARNNNAGHVMLIIIIIICGIVIAFYGRISMRGVFIFCVTTIAGYALLGIGLTRLCQPLGEPYTSASMSVFSQTIVRAYVEEYDTWSEQELEELQKYMTMDYIEYVPQNADGTKYRLHIDEDKNGFFKFWIRIGKKHLGCYIDAFLANTQDMWFPNSVVDGYQCADTKAYMEYDKCYYVISEYNEYPIEHMNLLPEVLNFYKQIGSYLSFEKIPMISMLFSIGFQFWLLLNCMFYNFYKRNKKLYLPILIVFGYMVGSAFVPLVLLRYFAAIFLSMPMIIIFTMQAEKLMKIVERD